MPTLKQYFEFSQLAQAAYAHLEAGLTIDALKDSVTGEFSDSQAIAFRDPASGYTLLHHQPNDPNGFSASIFRNNTTGEITIAFRGTEFAPPLSNLDPGDVVADADIFVVGYARQQIISAYNYYQRLITPVGQNAQQLVEEITDQPPTDGRLFTTLPGTTQFLSYRVVNTGEGLGKLSPTDHVTVTGHSLGGHLAVAFSRLFSGVVDHVYTYNAPGYGNNFTDLFFNLIPGAGSAFNPAKITNVYGEKGPELVADLHTRFGEAVPVFIESATHSKSVLTDALALYDLFATVQGNIATQTVTTILRATSGTESRTLENGLDALRKLFLGGAPTATPPDDRNAYYTNVLALRSSISPTGVPLAGHEIRSLVGQPPSMVVTQAQTEIAYRYALKELNPFVVVGADYTLHNETGELALINPGTGVGELTPQYLADRAAFLAKKIEVNGSTFTSPNFTHFKDNTLAEEITPPLALHQMLFGDGTNETLSGGALSDQLYGGSGDDHLNGGAGSDYLEGNRGDDTLDGGSGADTMLGGQGNDTYLVDNVGDVVREYANSGIDEVKSSVTFTLDSQVENLTLTGTSTIGGIGNELGNTLTGNSAGNVLKGLGGQDHLIGNGGNDVLEGGTGDNDLLEGGAGFDTYIYNSGDGTDQIEDSDARGRIIFNGRLLVGGVHNADDPANTYHSFDDTFTYVMSGGHLIVNGVLTVNADFQSGQFGIELFEGPETPSYENGWETKRYYAETGFQPDGQITSGTVNVIVFGSESTDTLDNGPNFMWGNDQVYGYGGGDFIAAGLGHDRVYGGDGNDKLIGGNYGPYQWPDPFTENIDNLDGDDYLDGGNGNDGLTGLAGNDRLFGGDGNDSLRGDGDSLFPFYFTPPGGNDFLDGGSGDDLLLGDYGADVLFGGDGDDILQGDYTLHQRSSGPGEPVGIAIPVPFDRTKAQDDFLDGGAGNDDLYGDGGNDTLVGGAGNDQLFGDYNETFFVGDSWTDEGIRNDFGNDVLDGGDGDDLVYGMGGDDVLAGGEGIDQLYGSDGADEIYGGAGNDFVSGDFLDNVAPGDDVLHGDAGDDLLLGAAGNDFLDGGEDNDELQGGVGNDLLFGRSGDDRLFGQEGNDELSGEEGVDALSGGEGNDTLFGDDGNDTLLGDEGNDNLFGGVGNDGLRGGAGDDVLDGGAGNDFYVFHLGDGHDVISDGTGSQELNELVFGPGIALANLTFVHDAAQQILTIQINGGSDSIQLLGVNLNNVAGTTPIKVLSFADGSQVALADQLPPANGLIEGDEGDETIRAGSGNDVILAGAGNDTVNAGAGNDILIGGTGNDDLQGGTGQDSYIFNAGDGSDVVFDSTGEGNRLVFGAGLSADSIQLGLGSANSLVLRSGSAGDVIQILDFNPTDVNGAHPIESFEFADGTVLSYAQLVARGFDITGTPGSDTIVGTNLTDRISAGAGNDNVSALGGNDTVVGEGGNDILRGGDGDDVLDGGTGDDLLFGDAGADTLDGGTGTDTLAGGDGDDTLLAGLGDDQLVGDAGNDTYRFNLGDGLDTIFDPGVGENNVVVFGSGIISNALQLGSDGSVIVKVGPNGDGIRLGSASDVFGPHSVDTFQFADGTSLTYAQLVARGFDIDGTTGDDFLFGTNVVDRFRGGAGNDSLNGGAGNDSYFFNVGNGVDTVFDTASPGVGNEIVFGPGIVSSDLRLDLAPEQSDPSLRDLLIRVGTNGDAIQLDTFDRNNVFGPRTVETFRFADGSMLTYDQLLARGFDFTGTAGVDQLDGTNIADRMVGLAGADVLRGGLGDDQLDGGVGDDRLIGGQGNDTYLFGPGSGQDMVVEFQGSADKIRMAPGVAPSDVVVTRNDRDLVFSLNGGADRLTVSLYFLAPPLQIEQVLFADGTVWDQAFIENLTRPAITGTSGSDALVGTSGDDRLLGLGGNDQLSGLAGNDLLDGGTDADTLTGGAGNDTFVVDSSGDVVIEAVNEGTDSVLSSVTYSLGADVENLTLTGNAAINGTGNQLNNVLTGNSAANILAGGLGNDTYVVGAGDTVVELAGEGTDTVVSDVSTTLGANLENLTIAGSRSLIGAGNSLDNVLLAPGSISILAGGLGNDTYVVGSGDDLDVIVETPGGGVDTVRASQSYRLPDNVERLELIDPLLINVSGADPLQGLLLPGMTPTDSQGNPIGPNGTGNSLANTLVGTRQKNVLDGGVGADTLIGGGGDDAYVIDSSDDVVIEALNEGTDSVQSSANYTLSANVENLTLTGTGAINGTGNALANTIVGNDSANVLDAGAGNDFLQGFGGADTYLFGHGSGQDTVFDFSAAGDVDTIQFAADVAPTDVSVYQRSGDLVLAINGTADELTLFSFFSSTEYAQKQVRFSDGMTWNESELRARAVSVGGMTLGTIGNDALIGGAGQDVLIGDAGDDILTGGLGNDVLFGNAQTNNPFFPVIGNDTLLGGPGDDILRDFHGTNLFDGGAGNDSLFLGSGQDTILFGRGAGSDLVYFDDAGSDVDIIQLAADISPSDVELARGYPSSNVLTFRIRDTSEQLTLVLSTNYPTVMPDTVQGRIVFADGTHWDLTSEPTDPAVGSTGSDVLTASFPGSLQGLAGDDQYLLGSAGIPGSFSVIEAIDGGTDTVQSYFGYTLDANVENLILVESGSSVLSNPVHGTGNELNNIIIGNTGDNVLDGGLGNDVLIGGFFLVERDGHLVGNNGSDILIGGKGDDTLIPFVPDVRGFGFLDLNDNNFSSRGFDDQFPNTPDDLLVGGQGNDTYVLFNSAETLFELLGEGVDTVRSTVDYTLGDNLENLTLLEKYVTTPWAIQGVGNELDNVLVGNVSGNILQGQGGDDTLWGGPSTSVTSFNPGEEPVNLGNDTLIGGAGNDTYLFNRGDGIDTIQDISIVGEGNRIQFGDGITRTDLTFTQDQAARTLTIQVGSSGLDKLVLTNFDPTNANGSLVVETLAFADGSTANLANLLSPGAITGTAGNDVLTGTSGNDTIIGGTGNDTLSGGAGNDTYVFNPGDGVDTINDTSLPGAGNELQFGPGIASTDLSLGVGSLLIRIGTNGDAIHLTNFDPTNVLGPRTIETFRFADGTVLAYDQLIQRGFDLNGTSGNDTITGTNMVDRITGLPGNDTIQSGAGDDVLDGGAGADSLSGGAGNDRYLLDDSGNIVIEAANEGTDTVQSSLSYTLGANVENLTLMGTSAIDGTGNELANVLTGNSAANVLAGGDGNDTLTGNAGNDILNGGVGADMLVGGDGDDLLYIDAQDTSISGGTGTDQVSVLPGSSGVTLDVAAAEVELAFGAGGNDTFDGTSSTSALFMDGGAGDDVLTGGSANDTLAGGEDNDTLTGNAGNDILNGGVGADVLSGGAGDDLLYIDDLDTVIAGGAGTDQASVLSGSGGVTLDVGAASIEIAFGGDGNDTFTGATATVNLSLDSGAGNDVLTGGSGNDVLAGGIGNDTLTGSAGNDILNGGAGADVLSGGAGDDLLYIDADDTSVNGGAGSSDQVIVTGVAGVTLDVAAAEVELAFGAGGNDTFDGTSSTSALFMDGGAGDDVLTGGSANDTLAGGEDNDRLTGGAGDDILNGGAGDDTYFFNLGDGIDTITEATGPGTGNTIVFGPGITAGDITLGLGSLLIRVGTGGDAIHLENFDPTNVLGGPRGIDTFKFADNSTLTYTQLIARGFDVPGTVGDDILIGTNAVDRLIGGAGNDRIEARAGNDRLDGGTGADQLLGEQGDDTYVVDHIGDVVTENVNEGIDTVESGISYTLGANVENLTLTGTATINGTGNSLNNAITGNSAANVLDGGAGADTLTGGAGGDLYIVDNVGDVVTEQLNEGTDTVQSSVTYTLGANIENLTLTGTANLTGNGNQLNNALTGNSGNNVLAGGVGADTLAGGSGDDTYVFNVGDGIDAIADTAVAGAGNRIQFGVGITQASLIFTQTPGVLTIQVGSSGTDKLQLTTFDPTGVNGSLVVTTLVFADGSTVPLANLLGGATITGTNGNDVLTGTAGNDLMNALGGNDLLNGLAGNDTLDGGTGTDTMQGGTGNDTYIVDVSGDVVTELANEGTDTVQSSITYTLGANVENLTLTGTANINGTGNSLDNILVGNSGANVLTGGAGNDTYVVGAGDTVIENAGGGTDTVQSSVTWTLSLNVENLTLTGTANINGTGSSANNILIGNSGNNQLDGGSGNDSVDGGDGNDNLLGGSGDDTLVGGLGDDTLNAGSGNDVLNGGEGIDTLDGGSGDDQLLGGAGSDQLTGGSGADQFTGGAGNDTLTGGSGNDLYSFGRGDGQDTIVDSDPFPGNADRLLFGTTINPLDLVLSRQANDLRIALHGTTERVTIQNWYTSSSNQVEDVQAGNGQHLLNTQVDQLIQAMAAFSQQSGLTWDQAIDQRPQDVQNVLAASWQ